MMKIITLFKKPVSLLAVCLSISLCSCVDNEEEINTSDHHISQDIEVSEMGKWLPGTRNDSDADFNIPVLHFRNEQVYFQTIEKLNEMSAEKKKVYFKELGFNGAYTLWSQADEELDQIFDNADTLQMEKLIGEYKIKYERLFSFNAFDKYDATPYFSFTDNDLSLVGNIKGYVVIGNELKAPQKNTPTYDMDETAVATRAAIFGANRTNFVGFQKATVSVKNKNAISTMTIGRMANSFAVLFNTKKKVALWNKKVKTDYSATLYLHSTKMYKSKHYIVSPYGMEIFVLDLDIETIGNTFDADVDDFKCSIGSKIGRKLFHNIQVS
ncbi:DUF4848 domain-containing protein [Bacteroides sp. AN502(2024)]|uniref:DUF4848 domain-containing protein n=1 Tax=Bacteroides sp. AN502(2024) TaxID=3160599 RepID=UPI0035164599